MLKNKMNGKSYIGQTIRPIKERLKEHRSKKSKCSAVYDAIKKYGWNNFERDWYECPDGDLNFDEELLVKEMMTLSPDGYNLIEGGGSGGKRSEETKQKIGDSQRGIPKSEEHKRSMREAHLGIPNSEKHNKNISDSIKGENNHRSKKVYQYDLEGTLLCSFGSSGEAAEHLKKKDGSKIRMCARGELKTAYGFKWTCVKI